MLYHFLKRIRTSTVTDRVVRHQRLKSMSAADSTLNNKDSSKSIKKHGNITLVACGSFNPVTFMHLRLFELARDYLSESQPLSTVKEGIMSPVGDRYGKPELVEGRHRKEMCRLAVADSTWIQVNDWEMEQPEWMPTVKVLEHFENQASDHRVMLLCGADILHSFSIKDLWLKSDIEKIVKHFGMVVVNRPSSRYDATEIIGQSELLTKLKSHIHVISEIFTNDVSSTSVRKAVQENKSIKYLIPTPVADYIKLHKLYVTPVAAADDELAPFKRHRKVE